MKNKKMKPFIILLAGTLIVSLNGCGNTIPSLSEEQEALVVEYASTAVLKHDANYQGKLVDLSTLKNEEETPVEETMQAPAEEADIPKEPEQMQEPQQDVFSAEQAEAEIQADAEQILGLQDVSLTYSGYEVDEFYPKNGNEIYFVMNATPGNNLLVVKFTLRNLLNEEQDIQIQPGTVRVKIIMNGEEKNALTTMLLNDLATYQGTLGPNEETELVVVGEYPVEDLQTIDSLSVKLKNESGEVVLNCD
jgi:uncharacterized protein YceK